MQRVEVYRNLRNGMMSVRECGGKVMCHDQQVFIESPQFIVQPAGRAKVLRERRKCVHAFIRGSLRGFKVGTNVGFDGWKYWNQATYNPYQAGTFTDKTTGDVVHSATRAVVTTRGVFYAE